MAMSEDRGSTELHMYIEQSTVPDEKTFVGNNVLDLGTNNIDISIADAPEPGM